MASVGKKAPHCTIEARRSSMVRDDGAIDCVTLRGPVYGERMDCTAFTYR